MNLDDLTLGQAKQLAAMFAGGAQPVAQIPGNNRPVIVRSRDAGVQFGELVEYAADGSTVTLARARQLWKWKARQGGTLLDCAQHGVNKVGSKFSGPCDRVIVLGACAIIDCTPDSVSSIEAVSWS